MFNIGWTTLLSNRATNELKFSHVGEDRVDGNLAYMNVPSTDWNTSGWISDLEYVGLNGRDQFDIGSRNAHADFDTGLAAAHGGADSRNYTIQDVLTYVTGGGAHTLKTGFTWNRPMVRPQRIGANDNGTFTFRHNLPYDPANAFTYPSQFAIVMGNIEVDSDDDWYNGFIQDQWRVTPNVTLNLGLRYDYQQLTPETKSGFAPRFGFGVRPEGHGQDGDSWRLSASSTSTRWSAWQTRSIGSASTVRRSRSRPTRTRQPIAASSRRRMHACNRAAAVGSRSSVRPAARP